MNTNEIIRQIDAEILNLQQARALLTGEPIKRGRGRPAKTTTATKPKKTARKPMALKPAQRLRPRRKHVGQSQRR